MTTTYDGSENILASFLGTNIFSLPEFATDDMTPKRKREFVAENNMKEVTTKRRRQLPRKAKARSVKEA
jgi:hypothetical protein